MITASIDTRFVKSVKTAKLTLEQVPEKFTEKKSKRKLRKHNETAIGNPACQDCWA